METEKSTIQHVHFSEAVWEKAKQGHGLPGWMVSNRTASQHVQLFRLGWMLHQPERSSEEQLLQHAHNISYEKAQNAAGVCYGWKT